MKTELRLAREPEARDDSAAAIRRYFSPGFDGNPDGFVFVDRKVLWSLPDAHRTDVQRKERQGLLFALNLALERHRGW